ncbi:MAG: hypothetical protein ACRDBO_01305 [Lachnospiraceae bacterium]
MALIDGILIENIQKCLKVSEKALYKYDQDLILRVTHDNHDHHAIERSIVFRYGIHLYNQMSRNDCLKYYHLDNEYNLNMDNYKRGINERLRYPDLIIHKRKSNEDNLIVIECKGWWSSEAEIEADVYKIKDFIAGDLKYKYGLLIKFNKTKIEYYWFNSGYERLENNNPYL